MNSSSKFNWQVRLATLSIFVLGFIAGALALNIYYNWFGAGSQPTKKQQYEKLFDDISLSSEQKSEVQQIVGEMRDEIQNVKKESEPRFQEIRSRSDARFQKIMTPEQWANFERERKAIRESGKDSNTNK